MEKNHWLSWTQKSLSSPNADMEDWRYSEERMLLRQKVFRALTPYLENCPRHVYEFCNLWSEEGNPSAKSEVLHVQIERAFQDYIFENFENTYRLTELINYHAKDN